MNDPKPYRFDQYDVARWGRTLSGLGAEVFEHRERIDDLAKRLDEVAGGRQDDMVLLAEVREIASTIRHDMDELFKRVRRIEDTFKKDREEHTKLHGRIYTRINDRLSELKQQDQSLPDSQAADPPESQTSEEPSEDI